MNTKIYISGKITGLKRKDYLRRFKKAENKLFKMGYIPINPAKVNNNLPINTSYDEYMQMSMCMLSFCDNIYMLKNWETSNGAKIEHEYALNNNYKIIYE